MIDEFFTVDEVATLLRVDPETIRRWLRERKLRGINFGRGRIGWRIRAEELEQFLSDHEPPSTCAGI